MDYSLSVTLKKELEVPLFPFHSYEILQDNNDNEKIKIIKLGEENENS